VVFASRTPVVVFSPTEVALSMGSSRERRRILDQIALYTTPSQAEAAPRCTHALKSRQRVLETRGSSATDLDAWEALVVRHGLETMATRRAASERIARAATVAFAEIGAPGLELGVRYAPGAPEDADTFSAELRAHRERDVRRGSATVGPHRDDLELSLSGHAARGWASQGQHRAIVLALKAAELSVVADARQCRPVLLLDDVSSELDRERTAALLAFLGKLEGQVFVTTTRPEWIEGSTTDRKDFSVRAGEIATL
jgi:DNA replication and repair protein RecF